MFKLKKNNITLDQQYETRSEAETAILDLITAEAKIISDASVAIKNTNDGWDLFVNGRVRWFYQIFEVHADAVTDSCWYEERWYDSDLENALLYHEVPVTEKTMALMKEKCEHLFDDKSARNEMLAAYDQALVAQKEAENTLDELTADENVKEADYEDASDALDAAKADVSAKEEAVTNAQNHLNELLGNDSDAPTLADAQAELDQASADLETAKATVAEKEKAVAAAQTALDNAKAAISQAETDRDAKKAEAERLEAELASEVTEKRNAMEAAEKVMNNASETLENAKAELSEKETAKANAESTYADKKTDRENAETDANEKAKILDQKTKDAETAKTVYETSVDKITPLRNAQTALDNAKDNYKNAEESLESAITALNDAITKLSQKNDLLASAKDFAARANLLSYQGSQTTEITDEDFAYLNEKVKAVLNAENALKAAKIKLAQTEETLATAKENLEAAKQQHTKTSAAVSIAKTIYESFLPKEAEAKEPDNGTVQATNTVKTSADTSSDKAQNGTLKAGTVKTGDTANAGAYGIALTGSILALGAALKKRRPSK